MKLKSGVIINEIDGKYVVVDASSGEDRFNGMLRMNKTAGYLAMLLQKETDEKALLEALLEKYDVTEEVARNNIQKVINVLKKESLLEI